MKTDIQIAQEATLRPITDVVEPLGISFDDIELYGKYKAKLTFDKIEAVKENPVGKLILVTAINPTPAGEGKSTMTPWGLLWESKVALPEVAMLKCFRWKILISILQAICMLSQQLIMPYQL